MTADDATPPLVAAPPVPPVVPDTGDALDFENDGHDSACELEDDRDVCFCSARRANAHGPVVPDSEALGHKFAFASGIGWYCTTHKWCDVPKAATQTLAEREAELRPSGSGVVPDKPALTPETFPEFASRVTCPRCSHHKACYCSAQCGEPCCGATLEANASVPAVTDDEATRTADEAALVLAYAELDEFSGLELGIRNGYALVAALRSAGFLIVHHTKET